MRRTSFTVSLILVIALLALGCPKKPKPQPPQPQLPTTDTMSTAETTATTQTVETTTTDFPTTPIEPRVESEDIEEINRRAQAEGWIADAFFPYDASTLDDAAQQALTKSASYLREHPQYGLLIEGHCDERGTEQYNLALGDHRAATASQYLQTLGIDAARLRTVSYGEERPFAEGSNEEAWAQNRRAHLVLVKR
ncbi:MAG TPA: peptidoglycan-associated lipoprotein Pal [Thermoanaerobaculia bacterium]|nr:peptidoglycan-associated lipoprotein Pal [Thermoanaerobaculia bacterium]